MENGNFKEQNLIEFCLHKYSKQTENYFLNWRKIQRMTKTRRGGAGGGGEGYEVKLRLLFIPLFFPSRENSKTKRGKSVSLLLFSTVSFVVVSTYLVICRQCLKQRKKLMCNGFFPFLSNAFYKVCCQRSRENNRNSKIKTFSFAFHIFRCFFSC